MLLNCEKVTVTDAEGNEKQATECVIVSPQGNKMFWLMIETCCFYLYIFSTVIYILWKQCSGACIRDAQEK